MSRIIKLGYIQQANSACISKNRENLVAKIKRLANDGAQLVVLQELHDSLYFCQTESVDNFDLAIDINGEETGVYSNVAKECGIVLVTSLFERRAPGLYHNTAVVFEKDGSVAGKYRKMHIPDDPAYYEKFYFTPGDIGFEPIQTSVGKLGVLVCWDQWYPEAARLMALKGAELLIYPTAIGWESSDDEAEKNASATSMDVVHERTCCSQRAACCRSKQSWTRTRPVECNQRNPILGHKLCSGTSRRAD